MTKTISRRDLDFQLYEVLNIGSLCERAYFSEHEPDVFGPMLDSAESIAYDHFLACNAAGDRGMAELKDGRVETINEAKLALETMFEAGFAAASLDAERGGLQLPITVANACMAVFQSANIGLCGPVLLTVGVANLIDSFGSPEQKETYIPGLLSGRYLGTMCLSEPHAGSSLTDIRTKAHPNDDGTYRLVGNKMWITGGEHELSENIIHMVLAKIPGGPPGVKGISLFIVPRFHLEADGSRGTPNDVTLAGLNHKMGQRISPNCVLNFGDNGDCTGFLVGEPHQGLRYMFQLMNEARIAVGVSAVGAGYAGFLYSLDYARERAQGRSPDDKDPTTPMVPIIRHTDVKRMLLAQKSYVEGALTLCLYASSLVDEIKSNPDEAVRHASHLLLEILIPIVKAWPSEWCLEANKHAIQILGGYGYTQDYPVEQLYRDNRLNMIHEGTNGIHGIDLLGRKIQMENGAAFRILIAEIEKTVGAARQYGALGRFADDLQRAMNQVADTTATLSSAAAAGKTAIFLANSSVYLDMCGTLVIAWMWLMQAVAAQRGLADADEADRHFYDGKLRACEYFFRWELARTGFQAERLATLDTTCLDMPEAAFSL